MRPYRHVVLGGTFDRLHVGHEALLRRAFASGDRVSIGVTTDGYLLGHPKVASARIQAYSVRTGRLRRWLRQNFPRRSWEVVPLETPLGRSVEPGPDALVVSPETVRGGLRVNAERRRRRLPALALLVVPLVLADDLTPISSSRLRSGELAPDGRRLTPISVVVAADTTEGERAVLRAIATVFPNGHAVLVHPAAGRTPAGTARRAASLLRRSRPKAEVAVGVTRAPRGWWVAVGSRRIALAPRRIQGASPAALSREVVRTLRPSARKPI